MRLPAAFTVTQTLHEDEACVLYRGVRMGDGRSVIIKALGSRWQPRDLERLKKEYELGTRLDTPLVLKPLALESHHGTPALVLEDFEGRSLAELRGAPLDRRRFLPIASRLAAALAAVHERGVIHKDIKPENIVLHPGTGEVRLIDLGLASLLPAAQQEVQGYRVIEGSLPYLSPEQTGRTSWSIDARTDLYSLGVTLYELSAGQLPFQADDPPGWIHCHLARVPSPLSEVVPGTPAVLSDIVAKLLAKAPEDRYRSALGLQLDLERCLASLTLDGRIEPFALGQRDASERFQVPRVLPGREQEIAEILAAFDRVVVAHTYLRQARSCHARRSAMGKVRDLDWRDPELFEPRTAAPPATYLARQEQLDLLSVAKASQSISREIVLEELVRALVRIAVEQGGARKGSLILAREGRLSIEAQARLEPERIEVELVGSPLSDRSLVPLSVVQYAARTRQRVVLGAAPEAPFAADEYLARIRPMSALCLPMVKQAEVVGLLYLENDLVAGAFTPERLMALELLATQAAISLENASLLAKEQAARAAAEAAESRSTFLAEAGALLSESLDYSRTLAGIARLCVRSMADWCVIDVLEGREIRRVGGAHADPAKEPLLHEVRQRYPPRPGSPHPAVMVLRTGEPLLISESTDDEIRRRCEDEDHARIIRQLGARTVIAVPLVARGQTLGVLSLCSASPGRCYGPADLELAQELARRAALAIDNARLYRDALGLPEAERLRTEAEAANRALQQQARALEAGKRAREEVLAVVSHDMKGPLSTILTSSRMLEKAAPGDREAEAARLISRSATRLTRLASDLLDFSAIEAGRLSVVRTPHGAASLAREAVETLQEMAQDRGVRLAADSVPAGLEIECDRDRIIQVLSNLLANAIHVSPRDGMVALSVAEDQDQAVFSVKDVGPGISPEELPLLFDRYRRGRAANYKGTGLGLAIARRLVELHGGQIWAESKPGCGSTFHFRLPAMSLGAHSEILVVDDDADIRCSLKAVLEIEGYHVALASNGFEAWERLQSAPLPALILLDLMMPVMNGAELLGRVRADCRLQSVPIVLVTACESLTQPVVAKSQGSLPKPFDPSHVIELASRYCTQRSH